MRFKCLLILLSLLYATPAVHSWAAAAKVSFDEKTVAEFYKGKTVRIIVGFSAGGGYDAYSRVIGRHLHKHILGNPTVVVDNMAGAGSILAANHINNVAPKDGTIIGNFSGQIILEQLFANVHQNFRRQRVSRRSRQRPAGDRPGRRAAGARTHHRFNGYVAGGENPATEDAPTYKEMKKILAVVAPGPLVSPRAATHIEDVSGAVSVFDFLNTALVS